MINPEGYKPFDIYETLYQLKEKKIPVRAVIGAVDYMEGRAVWKLVLPDFQEVKGIVPEEEMGVGPELRSYFVGNRINVIIKGIDRENGLTACSRREAVEMAWQKLRNALREGDIINTAVRAVINREGFSSLVVDVGGGVLTEIPRSEAVIRRTLPLGRQYQIGETVRAKIVSLEPLRVSIRAARPDPWTLADYRRGQYIAGTVYRIVDGNVFVEPDLTPGILGLAPVPLLGDIAPGYRVSCKVRYFSAEERKLHLYLVRCLQKEVI